MYIFRKTTDLKAYLANIRQGGQSIGFVPTMGALHQGHLSLVRSAATANDCVVCSIFVNPTQFNQPEDLDKYPRTTERDIELLVQGECDVLFLPASEEVYPDGVEEVLDFKLGDLGTVMEAKFRPGHFEGVAQVMKRLLEMVKPHRLYMGQKDFQQVSVVQALIRHCDLDVELAMEPTVREPDGLAMSSRNVRLTGEMRKKAAVLYQSLQAAAALFSQGESPAAISRHAIRMIEGEGLAPEYVELVDGNSLQPVAASETSSFVVACVAAWAGDVRLIDNLILRLSPPLRKGA